MTPWQLLSRSTSDLDRFLPLSGHGAPERSGQHLATSRLKLPRNSNRTWVHCDAGGGSRPQDQLLTLALAKEVDYWSLTTLREKLVKIGAKGVRHGRYVTFRLAEVAVPRNLFREILRRIDELCRRPAPA